MYNTFCICGCSSSGRAPPCQGGGSEFEPRHPLHFALVAQLDRVTGYEPVGQGFESLPARHKKQYNISCAVFYFVLKYICDSCPTLTGPLIQKYFKNNFLKISIDFSKTL